MTQQDNSSLLLAGEASSLGNNASSSRPSRFATVLAASIMTVFWLFGLLANLLLIVALSAREIRKKRGTVNVIYVFIVSMAVNDLLNLCTNQTFVILSYVGHDWIVGGPADRPCQIAAELNMFLVATNMWHQTLIAIHRYIVVVRNRWYLRINKTVYSLVVVIATRLVPLAQSLPILISGEAFTCSFYEPKLLRCVFKPEYKTRTMIAFLTGFVVPCLLVVICFTLIFVFVHRAGRKVAFNKMRKPSTVLEDDGPSIASYSRPSLPLPSAKSVRRSACSVPQITVSTETAKLKAARMSSPAVGSASLEVPCAPKIKRSTLATLAEHANKLRASFALSTITTTSASNTDWRLYQREIQITKMFGVVFLVIVLGFVPYGLIRNADSNGTLHADAYVVVTALYAIASCLPPLVYGLMNQDVRWIMLSFLLRRRLSGPNLIFERNGTDQNVVTSRLEPSFAPGSPQTSVKGYGKEQFV